MVNQSPNQPGFWDSDLGKGIKGAALAGVAAFGYGVVNYLLGHPDALNVVSQYGIPVSLVYGVLNWILKRLDPGTPNVETVVGQKAN